ncbi:hypothetical protein RSOLAG1IB_10153 [Rhizoctonia solani AG-1 IB]|uniref:Uncharacterized protein n=1 Tax=Thanatephorus cucumeris (strain AG1-IB / isolate 7/3/14) TaxID=1108050 RepID=M5BZK9_THACB|nr:hypothetical protein BN14_06667 [Rhizoctonia solani AG-1 IB]CEL62040.1 hypothetical protein RSOLAG1IB_10153 [Rhizoctonia solani AG-1 IB]
MSTISQTPSPGTHPISVSSRFNLDSWDIQDADLLFLTPDQVFFYAHSSVILAYSTNYFGGLLVGDPTYDVCEEVDVTQPMSDSFLSIEPKLIVVNITSDIFNIVLLALYRFPIQEFAPSNQSLRAVIPALTSLGCDPNTIACANSELYGLLLKCAAADPLPIYAIAAEYSFESLAVSVSALTLKTPLHEISEDLARQMGPIYLKRIFFLHLGREDALRRVVMPQPNFHPPESNPKCDVESQKRIQRAWTLASAYVVAQNHLGGMNELAGTHFEIGA